jgi:hypothetical protein
MPRNAKGNTGQSGTMKSHYIGKSECNETVLQLFVDFKRVQDSVSKEEQFGVLMKVVRLIKMCLNETCVKFCVGKHLSDNLHTEIDLKKGDAPFQLFFYFALECVIRKAQENQVGHISC